MNKTQKSFLALAIALTSGIYSASAQIYVHVRPIAPIIVRTAPPSPRHIWIGEDWHENNGHYEHVGGHWAEPPREGYQYQAGHWNHSRRGHTWQAGGWHEGKGKRGGDHREQGDHRH